MSERRRFLLILVVTLFVLGTAFGFVAGRAKRWHERGWSGVMYFPADITNAKRKTMGVAPYHVMMTAADTPADGVLRYGDEILSLNGIPRDDLKRLSRLEAETRRGATVVYRIRRGAQTLDVPLQFVSPLRNRSVIARHIVAAIVAVAFVTIALLIIARAPRDSRATVFYALALLSAVNILFTVATVYEQNNARGIVISPYATFGTFYMVLAGAFMYPPLILHLCLVFPKRRPVLEKHPTALRWMYAVGLVGVTGIILVVLFMAMFDPTDIVRTRQRMSALLLPAYYIISAIAALVALNLLYAAWREGPRRAVASRPFRVVAATALVPIAISRGVGMFLSPVAAAIFVFLGIGLPMLVLGSFPILALVSLARSYSEARAEEKRQVAWPLWGLALAVGMKVLSVVINIIASLWIAFNAQELIRWRGPLEIVALLPMIFTLAIPISFAVAILKYRLMNIDVIIRKTVVYAVLSGAIAIIYLGLVGGLGSFLVYAFGLENQTTMIIGSTLVVALLFVPLRSKLQRIVDRTLFRHKYQYPEALKAISAEARTATDANEFLALAAEQLQRALQNRAVVIFAERQDEYVAVAKVGVADSLLGRLRVPASIAAALDRPFDPRRRTLDEQSTAALGRVEASLIVPAGTRAFIAAAPKLSNGEYDVEDIDFFRSAAEQLETGIDRIRMQAEEADFEQARQIQQTLLPREMPRVAGLEVSGIWQPARTMGGDYYDLIELQETELAVCIGDVAGKGMPAALLMSGLQAAVRASASSSPRDLCERVRRVVVSSLSGGRFVTFFYATVDTAAMKLRWCNAGHNAPILARADGSVVRLAEGGPAFSRLFKGARYEERELELGKGDRLVLFTDGVSEAADGAGEQFGETRIEELVTDCRDLSAGELQRTIFDAASSFSGGELEDDLTLVVVRLI
jgi:serine phosphatase RsbU (regulator of sigma subunit)